MSLIIRGVIDGPLSGGVPKAIELYAISAIADLSVYGLESANNGGAAAGPEYTLSGAAAAGDVLYIASETTGFQSFFGFAPTDTSGVASINGDDAIVLYENSAIVDVFGEVGVDGTGRPWDYLDGWASRVAGGPSATFDIAEWRFSGPNALDGETTNATAATPFPLDGYTPAPQPIRINEVLVSTTGADLEFIEFTGAPGASLDGLSLINIEADPVGNGVGGVDNRYDFGPGDVIGDNGFFLAANSLAAALENPNAALPANFFENSSSTIALVETASLTGDVVTGAETVIDAVALTDGTGSPTFFYGAPVLGPDGSFYPSAVGRTAIDGDFALIDAFSPAGDNTTPTAGTAAPGGATDVKIHEVQGATGLADGALVGVSGAADESPLLGQAVRVQGVVTTVLPDLGGFYVQEEDADADGDAATSEGVFVATAEAVSEGWIVTVEGAVAEVEGETRIVATAVTADDEGDNSGLVTPTAIAFPTATVLQDADGDFVANLEAYEGMLVTVPEEMTVTELFQLDRFGTIRLSSEGRLEQFTQNAAPDAAGFAQHLKDVAARSLVLDDGADGQNPSVIRVPGLGADGSLDAGDVVRMGDVYTSLTGVVSFSEDDQTGSEEPEYRIHLADGALTQQNPRPATPAAVGSDFKVAALNVLNFFTTLDTFPGNEGVGPNGLDPRGADTNPQNALPGVGATDEYQRQLSKLVEALTAMDADVVGLVEIENDFLEGGAAPADAAAQGDRGVAIQALVDAVNAALGETAYDWVRPPSGEFVGGDAIAVGFIYDTRSVSLVGEAAVLDDPAFLDPNGTGTGRNRAALAASFEDEATGGVFTAAVNHFKSKGASGLSAGDAANPDSDQGDGAGFWNDTRTKAAQVLADWLDTNPTGVADEDVVILGDLNAYAMETPITTLKAAGYADLAETYLGDDAYSYVFDGQSGTLDYALGSAGFTAQVTGVTEWHVNADEADAFDYNLEFGRDPALFTTDADTNVADGAYRNSDHDPVIVGLNLNEDALKVTRLAQFNSGVGSAGSEVVAFEDGKFYVTNGEADRIDVFTLADGKVGAIDLSGLPNYGGITSVAVKNGVIAVAVANATGTDAGFVALIPADDLTAVSVVAVGAGPDMVTFSADGAKVFVAIEGEPDGGVDPKGGVSIVTLAATLAASAVSTVDFAAFDGQEDALRAQGVRIFPGKSASDDFEPEYIAVDPQTGDLIVTLQEANAVAVIDPDTETVTAIRSLGTVDHSVDGNGIDASDRDGAINIRTWPVQGMRMADAIAAFEVGGQTYYATANEGDARDADERVEDLALDPAAFPDAATLQQAENLGRLEVSTVDGDVDGDGDYDALYSYGSRSFTIFNSDGDVVFDSGDFFEQYIATNFPDRFNSTQATQGDPTGDENRSDAKGPEPEAVAIAKVEGRTLAIIGMERDSGLFIFDVSDPANATFVTYVNGVENGDLRPEIITVIPPEQSATGRTEIAVSYEESGTTSVFELTFGAPSDPADFGEGGGQTEPLDPADFGFDLQITEIWPGNEPGDNLTADWIEITNLGAVAWTAAVDPDLYYDDESESFADADHINGIAAIAPGESVIVMIDDADAVDAFRTVWGDLLGGAVQVGWSDGAGLGQGGDAATLMFGDFEERAILDNEAYPDAETVGGRSYDPTLGAFSEAGVAGAGATATVNDEGQPATGTPGALPDEEPELFTLELLHIADQEAGIPALADAPRASAVFAALEAQDLGDDGIADNTIRLSSGDAIIPGLFFSASAEVFGGAGRADILIQNELGIQAIAFGNHEFDLGTGLLADLIGGDAADGFAGAAFPYLSANLDFATDANLAPFVTADADAPKPNSIAASTVIDVNGEKIGVVGATTPTIDVISSPGDVSIAPIDFDGTPTDAQLDALAAEIQADVDALLAAHPDMNKVILLAHMQQLSIEQALAERLSNVDIIVAGGSNTRLFDADDTPRDGDSVQGPYPVFTTDADGNPIAIVNTDGNYKYVGRLVVDFDENGVIIPDSYDETVSGAYRTDAEGVAALGAEGLIDPEIQAIVDQLEAVIVAKESNVFGVSDVYLDGLRGSVRTEETNLGNLTADANLAEARKTDPTVTISLKNGGGIRDDIGQVIVPPGGTGAPIELPNEGIPGVKPEGGISETDIANALRFNNGLTLVTVDAAGLKAILEHAVAASSLDDGNTQGRFPQISGMQFSFDLTAPAGARVQNATVMNTDGTETVVVFDGAVINPGAEFRMVTLNFLAGGGDGYPFPDVGSDIVQLAEDEAAARSGAATFAPDGSEQDALAEYLDANFNPENGGVAYDEAETPRALDERLQNLAFRADGTLDGAQIVEGTDGSDRLEGSEFGDLILAKGGRLDRVEGNGGADTFYFGEELTNGAVERTFINDYSAAEGDVLQFSQAIDSIRFSGRQALITLEGDGDRVYVRGDFDSLDDLVIYTPDDVLV